MIFFGVLQFPPPNVFTSSGAEDIMSRYNYFRFKLGSEPCLEICYIDDDVNMKFENIPCKDISTIL